MDHSQYLLTMFFEESNSFFAYLAAQEDDAAMDDVATVVRHLDVLLHLLLRGKEKLEAIGHCYEPLSEDVTALFEFRNMRELRRVLDRASGPAAEGRVAIRRGYLTDFAVSLVRLAADARFDPPPMVRYLDPRNDPVLAGVVSLLRTDDKSKNKESTSESSARK
ncbi:subunit of the poxvirus multiprotein entry-fusion complex [Squirrelpox virus]|uniref:Subunit of the poxvirus multiprotein entry-fusion complex n=1 Tax=Squirrelpox virus TaxID=240426 RepID=U3UB99_9POXV|nr:subunit of the poxvirus multiprotein entry-fusion complex [Squirrelpox virus]CCD83242.1 subunit of the poxvirus multiprotein entry-fusion complex [Squirrelpox virus]